MAAPALKILTANQLRSGEVLYWKSGGWVESLAEAQIFTDEAAAEAPSTGPAAVLPPGGAGCV